jgi:hypothetical protein
MEEKRWSVEIIIDEYEGQTRAEAKLKADGGRDHRGIGLARLNPIDSDVPSIGDELAAARALSDLAHQLIEATASDIENSTKERAHLKG